MTDPKEFGHTTKHRIGGGWGNHISWARAEVGSVYGHKPEHLMPKVGDLLTCGMKSGRVGVFRFDAIDRPPDPDDMFFGTVTQIGYEDE